MEQLLRGIFGFIFSILEFTMKTSYTTLFEKNEASVYNAYFISEKEISHKNNKGFSINGKRFLSKKDSYSNMILIGSIGSHKSTGIIIPTLINLEDSMVCHDPSGELFTRTAFLKRQQGFSVYVLNFGKPHNSHAYNPIKYAKSSISNQKKAAEALVKHTASGKKDFWEIEAAKLISLFIGITGILPEEYQNFHTVKTLISMMAAKPKTTTDILFAKGTKQQHLEYMEFLSYSDRLLTSIIASAQASLSLFADEGIALLTSHHEIDFEEFRKEKSILYIQNETSDIEYYKPLISLVFEQLFGQITSRIPSDDELDIFFIIDEASSLLLPSLPNHLSNNRKHKSGNLCVFQNTSQKINAYGRANADTMYSNSITRLFLSGGISLQDAQFLEATLGKHEIKTESGGKRTVPLMDAEAIRTLDPKTGICLHGSMKPIYTDIYPYFENSILRESLIDTPPFVNTTLPKDLPELKL